MQFVRKIANSNVLAGLIDIPEELKNKEVEIIILPYDNSTQTYIGNKKNVRGALSKYRNEELKVKENEAWADATVEKHENS
ncbi:hypothetical protein [Sedimentibacter sp.]|uniref:hypothetical protein n=1 Tax=Sedimentibacter sp. TaxID=1960295 RepID=UPI0028B03D84|nr:hypothetical protein [Sedimentibacter sp.]